MPTLLTSAHGMMHGLTARPADGPRVTFMSRLAGIVARRRRERQAVEELTKLSDRMLDDIGLSRGEMEWAMWCGRS